MLKIAAADRPVLERVLDELASITRTGLPESWEEELRRKTERWGRDFLREAGGDLGLADVLSRTTGTKAWFADAEAVRDRIDREFERAVVLPAAHAREDVLSLVLTGLVRRDLRLTCSYVRELVCVRVLDAAAAQLAEEQLERTDEDRVLLDAAVKAKDGFFTTFLVSPYSKYLARWAARRGLTPNQVTSASMLLGIAAAAAFATGQRWGLVTGAVLLQLAFTTDCVDGQLARYSRQFSKLGAWLDSVFDRGKEYVVYAGLAVGATRAGDADEVWLLAAAALTLQAFRHFVDFSYGAQQHGALDVVRHPPLSEPYDEAPTMWESLGEEPARVSPLRRFARGGIRLSHAFERAAPLKWAKRILVLPIGERFALISLSAALGGPRLTFTLLLAWGAVASVYTITGRVLRSLA